MNGGLTYDLPMPPSVNALYPGMRRRHKSKAYNAWIKEAGTEILVQGRKHLSGKVDVLYELGRIHDRRKRDASNYEKGISDLLVSMVIIDDDSLIEHVTIGWSDMVPPRRVKVIVTMCVGKLPFPKMMPI